MTAVRGAMHSLATFRRAQPADAHRLTEFARRAFVETFARSNTPEDMEIYLSSAFNLAQQTRELIEPARITLLAEVDGLLAGYAQLLLGAAPPCVTGPAPIELVRFYVDRAWQGRGIAQAMMNEVEAAARDRAGTLWLGVWEHNPRAIAFYVKCGFVDVGSHDFLLGHDRQTDRIMARPIFSAAIATRIGGA